MNGLMLADEKRRRKELEPDGKRINKRIVKGIIDRIGIRGAINTIPFGEPCGCLEECLVIAFGILNTEYGFNKIVKKDFKTLLKSLTECDDHDYFEKAIESCIAKGVEFRAVDISDCVCVEVDFKKDLEQIASLGTGTE